MGKTMKFKQLILLVCSAFVITACSSKDAAQEYDKPAVYWYDKMMSEIAADNLEDASDAYISLESEHRNSPLIASSLLILVNAYIEDEEYSLANFYLDEYIRKFGMSDNIDYIRYLKIKANFLGLKYQFRDQVLVESTLEQINEFKAIHGNSLYMPLVDTISARLYMAKVAMDKEISKLYNRIGKDKAAKYYKDKVEQSWLSPTEIEGANVPFYRAIFE